MRFTRPFFPLIGFMLAAWIILFLVTDMFLIPALRVAHGADSLARKQLAAISALVLAIILTCLLAILMLVLRPGRFFLPRKAEPKVRTKYVDAWAEAGQVGGHSNPSQQPPALVLMMLSMAHLNVGVADASAATVAAPGNPSASSTV